MCVDDLNAKHSADETPSEPSKRLLRKFNIFLPERLINSHGRWLFDGDDAMVHIAEKATATAGLPAGDPAGSVDLSEKKGPSEERMENVRPANEAA